MIFKRFQTVLALCCAITFLLVSLTTPASAEGNSAFLKASERCHNYIMENDFYYSQGVTLPLNREENRRADCSSFVSWCIYVYTNGEFDESKTSKWFLGVAKDLANGNEPEMSEITSSWKVISAPDDFEPGDIMCYSSHVHIYAGKGNNGRYLVYNAGSTEAIREEITDISESYFRKAKYALRLP